jgi:hypothetical protein
MKKSRLLGAVCACVISVGISTAEAALVTNGSMTHLTADTEAFNGLTPTDWSQALSRTADVFYINSTMLGFSWVSSTDGGTFLHGIGGDISGSWNEGATQTITGLVIGQQYELSFEQTSGLSSITTGSTGYWDVSFGAEAQNAPTLSAKNMNSWQAVSLLFTSSATSLDLSFVARSVDLSRVDLGLDGVTLTSTAVPIPTAVWLFGSGLVGLIGISRRKEST